MVRPTRNPEVVLQPRDAFTGFGNFVLNAHHDVSQTAETFFPGNRGFAVSTERMVFFNTICKHFEGAMSEFLDTGKVKFEEALSSFLVIPGERDTNPAFPESFIKFLTGKKILTAGASEQLPTTLPKVSAEVVAEDLRCRQALLAALSVSLGCEALATSTVDDDESLGKALVAMAKLSLPPLEFIFQSFLKARIALRKEALKGCDLLAPHCAALMKGSPFSVHIFAKKEVDLANSEALRLNISLSDLLKLSKTSGKRKRGQSKPGGKKGKGFPSSNPAPSTSNQSTRGAPRGRSGRGRGQRGRSSRGRGASSGQSQTKSQPQGNKSF